MGVSVIWTLAVDAIAACMLCFGNKVVDGLTDESNAVTIDYP